LVWPRSVPRLGRHWCKHQCSHVGSVLIIIENRDEVPKIETYLFRRRPGRTHLAFEAQPTRRPRRHPSEGLMLPPSLLRPGVPADSLKIGILGSLTGPFAIFGSGNLAGATLAFEQANAAGGIHGRKLEWLSLDDESSPPKGIAAYKRLVGPEQVFAVFGPS